MARTDAKLGLAPLVQLRVTGGVVSHNACVDPHESVVIAVIVLCPVRWPAARCRLRSLFPCRRRVFFILGPWSAVVMR